MLQMPSTVSQNFTMLIQSKTKFYFESKINGEIRCEQCKVELWKTRRHNEAMVKKDLNT